MTTEFGFTATERSRRVQNRRSFMAHPVQDDSFKVVGVIFLDSTQSDALPPSRHVNSTEVLDVLAAEIAKVSST